MSKGGLAAHQGPVMQFGSRSWAAVLGGLPPTSDNKNVLEVILEKDFRGSFTVSDSDCLNLIRRLGFDTRPGVHLEEVQICPNGRGIIYLTLKKELDVGKFCCYDVIQVTSEGIRAVNVKPSGKREVVVTLRGLHPNTSNDRVIKYLRLFGDITSTKVIYGTFSDGPLKGMRNGDRSLKVEIKPTACPGSYHVIDGHKITMKYPGMQQTCGRCLNIASSCKGRGVAKKCQAEGGVKADFVSYILDLWHRIGYTPDSNDAVEDLVEAANTEVVEQNGGEFTPMKVNSSPDKFTGVTIKNIPRNVDHGEVMEFLVNCGVPQSAKDHVTISENGVVSVRNLENSVCLALIECIHMKRHFSQKLYCNGYVPLSPQKKVETNSLITSVVPDSASSCSSELPAEAKKLNKETIHLTVEDESTDWPSVTNLVRRHSLSLRNRSPHKGSLAEDLLNFDKVRLGAQTSLLKSSINDLTDVTSDFNSCQSPINSSDTDSSIKDITGFVRKKGKKRVRKRTPDQKNSPKKSEKSETSPENKKKHIKL